jgi:predicted negative regulator of RcsB-dependent stress response
VDEYLNEKEQWERLLAGLREQAPWMLAGVAVVAAAFGGWHLWQVHAEHRALEAAGLYSRALDAFTRNDLAGGVKIADRVVQEFSGSAYSDQVNLAAARVQAEAQQLDQAAARLQQVMQNTHDPALALVARLRLARVQLAQNKPDAAIKTLDAVPPGAFTARYAEVRGDALLAKGDRDGALAQYRAARAGGADTVDAELLDLKINELARS